MRERPILFADPDKKRAAAVPPTMEQLKNRAHRASSAVRATEISLDRALTKLTRTVSTIRRLRRRLAYHDKRWRDATAAMSDRQLRSLP
jgi:hypothetical protein